MMGGIAKRGALPAPVEGLATVFYVAKGVPPLRVAGILPAMRGQDALATKEQGQDGLATQEPSPRLSALTLPPFRTTMVKIEIVP